MVDVLFIWPRFEPHASPPLGIARLAAVLRKKGVSVDILDCTFESGYEVVLEKLKEVNPKIVGLSILTPYYPNALKIAGMVKEFNKDITVLAGGAHPTCLPERTLAEKDIDIVVIQEAEVTIGELYDTLMNKGDLSKVDGICFEKDGKPFRTKDRAYIEDLDSIPLPARDLLPMEKYFANKTGRMRWSVPQPSTSLMATRGCPYNCTFCATKYIFSKKVRYRSVENIMKEVRELKEKYGIKGIFLADDTFTIRKEWLREMCEGFKKEGIKWFCATRVNLIDKEKLQMMKDGGCALISFGIESGNQSTLDNILKKGITLEQIRKAYAMAKEVGIPAHGTCMIGLPGETEEDMQRTIDFVLSLDAEAVQFSILTPYPGTEIYEYIRSLGGTFNEDWSDFELYDKPVYSLEGIDPLVVKKYLRKAYRSFYFRPKYLVHRLKQVKSPAHIGRNIAGLHNLGRKLVGKS